MWLYKYVFLKEDMERATNANKDSIPIASPEKGAFGSVSQADTLLLARSTHPWRQWVVTPTLVFSDILLALLVWCGAYVLHSFLGRPELMVEVILGSIVPNVLA